jgi:hypothetical protein
MQDAQHPLSVRIIPAAGGGVIGVAGDNVALVAVAASSLALLQLEDPRFKPAADADRVYSSIDKAAR